jgi:NDP-4-keto-2,6-dideoxyhexose 3-C-methyltransferase
MATHLREIVERTVNFAKPNCGDLVLDIGCNDGTMLNYYYGLELTRLGIDPSSEKFISNFQDDIKVKFDFFTKSNIREMIGDRTIKIITSIAMFYDIEDPISFMRQIKSVLSEDGIWVLESSYLPLLLENLTYDQICHEHVTYLALKDINYMMAEVGLRVFDVDLNQVNGGSLFIIAGHENASYKSKKDKIKRLLSKEKKLSEEVTYNRFKNRLMSHKEEVRHFIDLIKKSGQTIYGYGASTKGNIVLNYCDLTPDDLPAISDRNQEKHGLVTPGTGIPIISHEQIRKIKPDYLLVLIWHFRREVIDFELDYLERGGKLVFHLPRLHIVDKHNYKRYLNASFKEQAYQL